MTTPGLLTAIASAAAYALSYVCLRKGQADTSPPDSGLLPVLATSLAMLLILTAAGIGHRDPVPMSLRGRTLAFSLASGVVGTFLGRRLLYLAVHRLGAVRGAVLKGLSPVVTVCLAYAFLGDPVSWRVAAGLLGVLCAIALLALENRARPMRDRALFSSGAVIGVTAACLQGVGHVFRRAAMAGGAPASLAALIDVAVATLACVVSFAMERKLLQLWRHYRLHLSPWLLAAGASSALGVVLFFASARLIPVGTVATLAASEPVFVALFSWILMPQLERPTLYSASAACLVGIATMLLSHAA
ncbi:DMT family transporter [Alicyclobacillus vulcanalis]|uniref:EamA-like transporter family protein n=1 Tax=Alicyclobacillus vulcanalis TaxID=252246 RepID=A0A1N7M2D5_9BACL|nr:DMT family transporter [Alicyclobacillus vulcanalis]SIS80149.1 EamA-like transporter family protein [Alicyclobacillus vulcanalis]